MSTIDTSTWSPDSDLNVDIGGIPLNADAPIQQAWQAIQMLMAALKGDTNDIKLTINQPDGTTIVATNQTLTVVDNGHSHTIANVAGLQTALDGKAADADMTGATASADGASGLVPQPEAGDQDKVLKGDGTWGNSVSGNAATATKLATARTISAGNLEFQGSASFDGSAGISLNVTPQHCICTIGNRNNYPYHRIGYVSMTAEAPIDRAVTLLVNRDYCGGGFGICRIVLRTNSATQNSNCEVKWLVRTSQLPVDSICVGFSNTPGATYLDIFYKSEGAWNGAIFRVLACSSGRAILERGVEIIQTARETSNTTESNPGGSVESYASISAAGTALHNAAYTSEITASDDGVVSVAATVQTPSDERMKTPISAVPDEVLDAWEAVNWGQFQYLEALEEKGEDARVHLGLIAQRVDAVFSERGLDACGYGILCRDEASGLWTIRYAEALVLEAVCQRRRADRLEARIAALEEAMNA